MANVLSLISFPNILSDSIQMSVFNFAFLITDFSNVITGPIARYLFRMNIGTLILEFTSKM